MSYLWMMAAGLIVGAVIGAILLMTVFQPSVGRQADKGATRRDDFRKAA